RRFELAALIFLLFSILTSVGVNPVYEGTGVLKDTHLSKQIKELSAKDKSKWVSEGLYLENLPSMNGAPSLSGLYSYPQLSQWSRKRSTPYRNLAPANLCSK